MTEEALAAPAPAPAPVPTEAAEAAPAKVAAVETKAAAEEEHAGAARPAHPRARHAVGCLDLDLLGHGAQFTRSTIACARAT